MSMAEGKLQLFQAIALNSFITVMIGLAPLENLGAVTLINHLAFPAICRGHLK
jgi:hypothetical protein